ncbi:MAG TPA: TIGR00730 family Rossman fold protein [Burkholderiales bacterium]|nr:TIGR00730 family Rossman fold protein [Burkholderiales bacterium]
MKRIPRPPHPRRRRKPLPRPAPSPRVLRSPSYREAEDDAEFLKDDAQRGIRLLLEYQKVESILERERVAHTVLVLGSTRTSPRSDAYKIAREFGRIVARAGRRRGGAIVTGGGPGIMEAANRGAYDAGAPSVGLNISLPQAQYPNRYVTPALSFLFRYFALRKMHFLLRARAVVAFPGGFGTFDELFETLTLVQTRKIKPLPIVLVGESYWRRAFDVDFLLAEGKIDPEDKDLFWHAESAPEIWRGIRRWYRLAGEPVFPS